MDPVSLIIGGIISLANKFFPDKDTAAKFEHELKMFMLSADVQARFKNMEINDTEARHPSLFVAGWRPAVGWMGVVAMGLGLFTSVILPAFLAVIMVSDNADVTKINLVLSQLKAVNVEFYVSITLQMLGFGALRTYEKQKGISENVVGNRRPPSIERQRDVRSDR